MGGWLMYGAPEEWKKWTRDRRMQWLRNRVAFYQGQADIGPLAVYWRDQWIKKLERMSKKANL